LGKTAIEPEVVEQLRIWATELAEIEKISNPDPLRTKWLNDPSRTRWRGAACKRAQYEAEIDRNTKPSSVAA
jgi:hypothetical protein